jgi:hypothetical protein
LAEERMPEQHDDRMIALRIANMAAIPVRAVSANSTSTEFSMP